MEPLFFEHAGPFFRFQGDTVGSGESGRDESNIVDMIEGNIHGCTCTCENKMTFPGKRSGNLMPII
jgi:hypothetical protein